MTFCYQHEPCYNSYFVDTSTGPKQNGKGKKHKGPGKTASDAEIGKPEANKPDESEANKPDKSGKKKPSKG